MSQALRYQYKQTAAEKVNAELAEFFAQLEGADKVFNRAANANVIIPLSSPELLEALEPQLDVLSFAHPSRFFVVYFDEKAQSLSTSVSARCHALSKSEHVCAEIIRIGFPRREVAAVPSLIRACLLTGMQTEFYLFDGRFDVQELRKFSNLGDSLILDSADFEGRYEELYTVQNLTRSVLDLQWVGLGLWRDEIKALFERPFIRSYLPAVRAVEITASSASTAATPASALLLGAWILDRMRLGSQVRWAGGDFECIATEGQSVRMSLRSTRGAAESKLLEVLFRFDPLRIGESPQDQYIRVSCADSLETMVDLNVSFRTSRPVEDNSKTERLKRYFLIGESVTNYTASAALAQRLERMQRNC